MSSLSTKAGIWNPKGFHIESRESTDFVQDYYKDGVYQGLIGATVRSISNQTFDSYRGKLLTDFHKRKNAGELLPYTDYSYGLTSITKLEGSRENSKYYSGALHRYVRRPKVGNGANVVIPAGQENPWGNNNAFNDMYNFIDRQGIDGGHLVQKAASGLYSSGHDSLTFLAELHKVVAMFRGVVRSALSLASAGGLANAWLQGRYGWRILVYDIQDLNAVIQKLDNSDYSRARKHTLLAFTESEDFSHDYVYGSNITHVTHTCVHTLSAKGSIMADFVPPTFSFNPVVTAWELIPYSFVIDWIINVGQAIEALSFLTFNPRYTASYGFKYNRKTSYNVSYTGLDGWTVLGGSALEMESECKVRNPITVPYLPSISPNLNAFKVLDLVALFVQALRRK